ncbi:MAG: carbamoyl phosphate synthase large subunit, partial [Parvibaculaceae bacterium]|nr:carbamoyl phosphate synthase large subunit [Parvibaculaceae bacterium]
SGDSACSLPPYSLSDEVIADIERQTREMALALNVVGLMNVQYAIQGDNIYVLEVNPRASRTVPFVAKVIGVPIAKIATRIMAGEKLTDFNLTKANFDHVAVKEAVFPFARFPGVDTVLGPEMRSTGEVIGLDKSFAMAFAKSQMGASIDLPNGGVAFISVKDSDKPKMVPIGQKLEALGFELIATGGTASYLLEQGLKVRTVNKVLEGRPHIVDEIENHDVTLVINTTEGMQALADSKSIRRSALMNKIPYYTTVAGARAAAEGIAALRDDQLEVTPLQTFHAAATAKA